MTIHQAFRRAVIATMLPIAIAIPAQLAAQAQQAEQKSPREITVVVDGAYLPDRIEVQEGERIHLKFLRKDAGPCTRDVLFPKLNIRRELLTDKTVVVELPALAAGEYEFKCGMNMVRGKLVVVARKP